MAAIVRSLGHQLMPVKYSSDVPDSRINAPIFCSVSKRWAFATRAPLSCAEMGNTSAVIGCSLSSVVAAPFDLSGEEQELIPATTPVAAAMAERLIKSLLFNVIQMELMVGII